MKLKVLSIVIVAFLSLFLVGCKKNEVVEDEIDPYLYVLSFNTLGGNDIETEEFHNKYAIILPTPIKDGYTFEDWYFDEECTDDFDLRDFEPGETTLYANWE